MEGDEQKAITPGGTITAFTTMRITFLDFILVGCHCKINQLRKPSIPNPFVSQRYDRIREHQTLKQLCAPISFSPSTVAMSIGWPLHTDL